MPALALTRKRIVIVGAVVLVVCVAAVVVLSRNTRASAGPLRHDDTLQTTAVEKTWQVERPELERCLDIHLKGHISGNARSTWGLTGPATVWENLRVHGGSIRVVARKLSADGECTGRATMDKVVVGQEWKTQDGDWRGYRQTRVVSGKGSSSTTGYRDTAVRLDGGAYDRGESYRPTLGVYVEPHWSINGGSASGGVTVEDTFELPVD